MNWKMNYWTLLFALAALGLAYQRYATGQQTQAEIEKASQRITCASGLDFSIADSTGDQRIQRYKTEYVPKVKNFAADSCNTMNGGVLSFGISECELQEMLNAFGEVDSVTALMSLLPGNGGAKDTLDLIFKVATSTGPLTYQYYDFTNPCPPCSEN